MTRKCRWGGMHNSMPLPPPPLQLGIGSRQAAAPHPATDVKSVAATATPTAHGLWLHPGCRPVPHTLLSAQKCGEGRTCPPCSPDVSPMVWILHNIRIASFPSCSWAIPGILCSTALMCSLNPKSGFSTFSFCISFSFLKWSDSPGILDNQQNSRRMNRK